MILSTRPLSGFEARSGLVTFCRLLWSRAGKPEPTIVWSPKVPSARINLRSQRIEIMAIDESATISGSLIRKLAGLIAHEFLHALWTDTQAITDPFLHALFNGLEDARIERRAIASGLFGNAAGLFGALLREFLPPGIDWQSRGNYPFSLAVHCRDYQGLRADLPAGFESVWHEARKRLHAAQDSADSLAIARWVLAQIGDQGKDQSDDQSKDQGDDQGDQSGDQGKDQGDQGNDQGDQRGKQGKPQGGILDPEAALRPDVSAIPQSEHSACELGADADQKKTTSIREYQRNTVDDGLNAQTKAALRRMLDNSGRSDLDGGRKAGSIDTRAIHRAAYDDRIFARRVEIAGIDTALYVLVDHSGSMAGSWIRTARNVTSAVYKAGIEAQASVAVGVFDSYPATIIPFGAGRKGIDLISRIEACGSTSMALAVRHALRTLIDRPEPRRILLVITDAHVGDDDASETRSLIAGGDRIGIQTLGIGIGRDISHGFADSSVIFEIGDLGPAAFAGLSKAIRRAA